MAETVAPRPPRPPGLGRLPVGFGLETRHSPGAAGLGLSFQGLNPLLQLGDDRQQKARVRVLPGNDTSTRSREFLLSFDPPPPRNIAPPPRNIHGFVEHLGQGSGIHRSSWDEFAGRFWDGEAAELQARRRVVRLQRGRSTTLWIIALTTSDGVQGLLYRCG